MSDAPQTAQQDADTIASAPVTPPTIAPAPHADVAAEAAQTVDALAHPKPINPPADVALDQTSITAREPIHAPEHREEAAQAVDAAKVAAPAAAATAPAPETTPVAQPASRVVTSEEFAKAEAALASYVGSKIDAKLTKGLILSVGNDIHKGKPEVTDLNLVFSGPEVAANFAELHNELMNAFSQLGGEPFKSHTIHKDEVAGATVFRMTIANVPTEQYVKLVQDFASHGVHAVKPVTPHTQTAETPVAETAPKKPHAPQPDAIAAEDAAKKEHTEATAPQADIAAAAPEAAAAVEAIAPQLDAQPSAKVEAPIIPLGQVKDQQQLGMTA